MSKKQKCKKGFFENSIDKSKLDLHKMFMQTAINCYYWVGYCTLNRQTTNIRDFSTK